MKIKIYLKFNLALTEEGIKLFKESPLSSETLEEYNETTSKFLKKLISNELTTEIEHVEDFEADINTDELKKIGEK